MSAWLWPVFLGLLCVVIPNHRAQGKGIAKKLNVQRYEDYSFEGVLVRAKEECSYMSLVNDTVVRNRTLQMVKEKIGRKKLKEFYQEKEIEKQKAKAYYEKVEKESRRRVLESDTPPWQPPFAPPGPFPPPPPLIHRPLYKRSTDLHGRRRKSSSIFSEVSFTDHNNCSSRCLFARMEMVDTYGFPDESLITKLIEDKITNTKIRLQKTKKVSWCFKKMEEVTFDDSCIFSSRLFDCLDLGESYAWSVTR